MSLPVAADTVPPPVPETSSDEGEIASDPHVALFETLRSASDMQAEVDGIMLLVRRQFTSNPTFAAAEL